jgi:hypothetical protein
VKTAKISGRFVDKTTGEPVDGVVEFIPSRFWVTEGKHDYATLAPRVTTVEGRFEVEVTPTCQRKGDFGWHYTVNCPVGTWTIKVDRAGHHLLRNLLPSRFTQ